MRPAPELDHPKRSLDGPLHAPSIVQLLTFSIVGAVGFVVDSSVAATTWRGVQRPGATLLPQALVMAGVPALPRIAN